MNKRTFLKLSSTLAAGAALSPLAGCLNDKPLPPAATSAPIKNWAGNLVYGTTNVDAPGSVEEIVNLVRQNKHLKVLGSQHCFNTIADSPHRLLSMKNMNKVIALDEKAMTVVVEPGIRYGHLAEYLEPKGYALHNLASLPHISVGGTCATATHGSGVENGSLATQVVGLEILTASGDTRVIQGAEAAQAAVHMGALGVVTKITLRIVPTFQVRQHVYENLPFAELEQNFEAIMGAAYSVSLFTDWQSDRINEVWVKSRVATGSTDKAPDRLYGATLATRNMHPIAALNAENCTEQMGVPGPWHERLPHFRMNFTPSSGVELQSEYFVPFEHAFAALSAIQRDGARWKNDLMISEIRTIAADDLLMSPYANRKSVAIHFTWKQNDNVIKLLPFIEAALAPFDPRPHWGKLFTFTAEQLGKSYGRSYTDFQAMMKDFDPEGKFQNDFLKRVFG